MQPSKIPAIICDLDGTLAIHDGRGPFEYHKCDTDLVNEPIQQILLAMLESSVERVLFVSGREDSCRAKTWEWLRTRASMTEGTSLYMRKAGDYRKDSIIKEEIYREQIEPTFDVLFVLDDRQKVVDMWRSIGLTCLQVAPGDF